MPCSVLGTMRARLQSASCESLPRANRSPVVCDKDSYPLYELSTAGEVTEVLEFNWMESLFHVNDDPAVRAQLLEWLVGA